MITSHASGCSRDTAQRIGSITHLDRFRAARAHDAVREETLMCALMQKAKRLDATVEQLDHARTEGLFHLKRKRSIAYAISVAEKLLPQPQRSAASE